MKLPSYLFCLKQERTAAHRIVAGTEAADTAADTGVVDIEAVEIEAAALPNQIADRNLRNNFPRLCHAHSYCTAPYCPLDRCLFINLLQPELAERQDFQMLDAAATKPRGRSATSSW
ncbi:unannotated protein [freshwater metagenome]|uniref:Unannotated protein n=1 Tax=freshwater metagenome TaxID=449393 RepID=A0A6J6IRK9_9ZZZZ